MAPPRVTVVATALFLAGCAATGDTADTSNTQAGLGLPDWRVAEPVDPQTLMGLDEEQIRKVLGEPDAVRPLALSRVWAYGGITCSLDLFFYLDLGTDRFRALTYTVTILDGQRAADVDNCVGSIRSENRQQAGKF